ncbi:tyrosine-protein kinase receptor UFO isoform X2 [Antennarius striatus]|uniref:tyrosine-protein kinase receptor UFO isoform X2 n=1 Tax=Antennarius striatus TaxID=241820 RepID=UPI0035AF5188
MSLGTLGPAPVLQACRRPRKRTVLSKWMKRRNAHHLLMDIIFAQEEEPSGHLSSIQVHLFDSDTPITTYQTNVNLLGLQTSRPFPESVTHMSSYLNHSQALGLGHVSSSGFQLGFSYRGRCVLITSIRLYYRRCPEISTQGALFKRTGAGSGPMKGVCVKGAAGTRPPVRECNLDGVWGPLVGGCDCPSGHQIMGDSCQEPPSAPVNLRAHHWGSVLVLTWDPPLDSGSTKEVRYNITCEEETALVNHWAPCEGVAVLPRPVGLINTSAGVTGLNPQLSYRLSALAWNEASSLLGGPPSSTATVIIRTWKALPATPAVKPPLNTSENEPSPATQHQNQFSQWQTFGILSGSLLLTAAILTAVFVQRRIHTKSRNTQQRVDTLPTDIEFSYRRSEVPEMETAPQYANMELEGVVQLLEGINSRLLDRLKTVLVERHKVTVGPQLGKGEFGSVCQGVFSPDDGVNIVVAVKSMTVGIHSREDLHELLREAEIMQHFDHPNVVKLLGVTLERDPNSPLPVPLVILPYMKHGDLRHFLINKRNGHVPVFVSHGSLLHYMMDIAAGMDYLSSQGFLHRDLAARNCMLGDDLRVRVADFGMSKKIYSSNYYRQKTVIRMPVKWMAIESLSDSVYTTKSDVWSFGITMWEIMSWGRTPYPGVHNYDLLDFLLSGLRLRPPRDCDHRLYEVMQSCWDREPTHRPGFRELHEALTGLLSELPTLEAFQEATYTNQIPEASSAACCDPQTEPERKTQNVYLPAPVGAASGDDMEVEEGYLKFTAGSLAV